MKLFKKFAAVVLALITGASVFALSACGGDKPFDGLFPPTGGDTINNGDDTTNLPDEGKGDAEAFFASLAAQSTGAAVFETEIGYSTTKSVYTGSSSVIKTVVSSKTDDIFARGAADLSSGDIDLAVTDGRTEVVGTTSTSDNFVSYFSRRDGHDFISREKGTELVDDYSDIIFKYKGDTEFEDEIAEIFQIISKFPEGIPANYLLAKLAGTVGTLKVGKASATIDVNATLYKIATDFQTVLKGVTADTTVSAILENATVKKYLSVFTELIPVEKLASFVSGLQFADLLMVTVTDGYLASLGLTREQFQKFAAKFDGVDFSDLSKIQPEENSTTYDYILKLLKSDELKEVINAAFFVGVEESEKLPKISELTLSQLLILAGVEKTAVAEKFNYLKNYADMFVSDSFTKTSFTYIRKFPSPDKTEEGKGEKPATFGKRDKAEKSDKSESYTLSNALIEFDLTEDGAATTEHISFLLLRSETEAVNGEVTMTERSLAVDAKVDFSDKTTLENIDNCATLYTGKSVIGASADVEIKRSALDGGEGIAPVVLKTLTDFGGNLTGVYICDEDGEQISNGDEFTVKFIGESGEEEEFTLSYTFSQYEESGDVKVSVIYGGTIVCSEIIWSAQYTFTGTVSGIISKK